MISRIRGNSVCCVCFSGVAPFPGATTGTGGRIRDVHCTGRGANVVAGTAGYSFGNLNIPGAILSKFCVIAYDFLTISSCIFSEYCSKLKHDKGMLKSSFAVKHD